jgi:hypothetical protein
VPGARGLLLEGDHIRTAQRWEPNQRAFEAKKPHAFSIRQHNLTALDLVVPETSCDLAMRTNDGRLAGDRNP